VYSGGFYRYFKGRRDGASCILKMDVARCSETSKLFQTTRCHIGLFELKEIRISCLHSSISV
jgi:hypothetical protein